MWFVLEMGSFVEKWRFAMWFVLEMGSFVDKGSICNRLFICGDGDI
jgi:hypothetical protein